MTYLKMAGFIIAVPFIFAFYTLVMIVVWLYGRITDQDVLET